MPVEHYYETSLDWTVDRKGVISSSVLDDTIEVATPPEFAGGIPGIWSPEHLLVAAVNSCVMTTFLAIAANSKLHFEGFHSKAAGKLEIVDGKYLVTQITVAPIISLADEADREKALRVLQKSEAACLISNSIRSTVIFVPAVQIIKTAH